MLTNKLHSNKVFCIAIFILAIGFLHAQETVKLVILHTNDTHSQVEPTDLTARYPDMGGYARRMGMIEKIRAEEPHVLLLDAGDYWQGSPYFNFFNGRIEIDAMNRMKYDAAILGNHEFDNGVDTLISVLSTAKFPVLCANYEISNKALAKIIKPYQIIKRGGVKIGVFGLSVKLDGLVMADNFKGVVYNDPVEAAIQMSDYLKNEQKCDVVICLSHLGVFEKDGTIAEYNNIVTDFNIATATRCVDVVIGGHSHSLIENATVPNADGKPVVIAQMGKSGLYLGRIDLVLEEDLDNK